MVPSTSSEITSAATPPKPGGGSKVSAPVKSVVPSSDVAKLPLAALRKHLGTGAFRIEYCTTPEELETHRAAWCNLEAHVACPNVFYGHTMLLAAISQLASNQRIGVAFVYHDGARPSEKNLLLGVFPLEWTRTLGLLTIRIWRHTYCYLGAPLVRLGVETETFAHFMNWVQQHQRRPAFIDFNHLPLEGTLHQGLLSACENAQLLPQTIDEYNRALLVRATDNQSYLEEACSKHFLQEARRQRRRLEELGSLEFRSPSDNAEFEVALANFLVLEDTGWKGQERSSLASSPKTLEYFRTICRTSFEENTIQLMGLYLNGEAIAMKCNFIAAPGAYAFKIAFDERYSRYSPGVLLELENIRILHQETTIQWMDSCATRGHFMISRLWGQQRTLRRILVPLGGIAELAVGLHGLARRAWRGLKGSIKRPSPKQNT